MKFREAALGNIADMICGDVKQFPYRSSTYLTRFFQALDLDYVHDGSTRRWWVVSVLDKLNIDDNGVLPSLNLIKVIEGLVCPDYFVNNEQVDLIAAIADVNRVLQPYELQVMTSPVTKESRLATIDGIYVSTAIKQVDAIKKITFTPEVFKIPDGGIDNKLISVMMPFSAEFKQVYSAISTACASQAMNCQRADDIWKDAKIIQDIFQLIYSARIVIVDFSHKNPNVMYETGIAHTLGKTVIPIAQSIDDVPSDVKHHRVLTYLNNGEGLTDLTNKLAQRIATICSE
jgi:hypothetical protein